jgi:4,5-DOPA dioxygenase extradiol
MTARLPCVFAGHGTPLMLDDARWRGEMKAWADAMPRPQSVLVLSGHWVEAKLVRGSFWKHPLKHDFEGLPKRYYELSYETPSARPLFERLANLYGEPPLGSSTIRSLDSSAYVPLMAMYPEADVPVLQMALPSLEVPALVELGRTLSPLRDEGVLVMASGVLVHNDRTFSFRGGEPPPPWAKDFDAWVSQVLTRRDAGALATFRKAPGAKMAHPTPEHLVPVAVALGASLPHEETVSFPLTGFAFGSLDRRCVQFG